MQRIHYARERSTTRTRSLSGERHPAARSPDIDPSAAVLTTLAPAFAEALPRLDGVPLSYRHELNADLVYDLCAGLIRAGVAKPGDWKKCNEDALTFAKYSVMQAVDIESRELLQRNVEFQMEIGDAYPDGYFYGREPKLDHGALAVSICCTGAGVFRLGRLVEALEQEAKGLGAAFYWTLIRSLYRVMRVYDHDDALRYEEMMRELAEQDDPENQGQYEFPEVKKALPDSIRRTLRRSDPRRYRRLLKANSSGRFADWIARLRRLEQLARVRVRDNSNQIEGNYDAPPLPSLIVFFEERDAITACFDEEAQSMLEGSAEPALFAIFSPDKEEEVARAIAVVSRFVAFNTELFTLIEEVEEWEKQNGRRDSNWRESSIRAE